MEQISDQSVFNVYYIKLHGDFHRKTTVKTKVFEITGFRGMYIRFKYITTDSIICLPDGVRQTYLLRLNEPDTYIIYDISEYMDNEELKTEFTAAEFMLCDDVYCDISEGFFMNNMFFVVNTQAMQTVHTPYKDLVPNYILGTFYENRMKNISKILTAYIFFNHFLEFINTKDIDETVMNGLLNEFWCGSGKIQYEFANLFKETNYILYYLWIRSSITDGNEKAINEKITKFPFTGLDPRTVTKYFEYLLDYGSPYAARHLYWEAVNNPPADENKIKRYTQKGFEIGGLINCYNYTVERSFVLGSREGIINHQEAMMGFKRFFDLFEQKDEDDFEFCKTSRQISYMYYAYMAELDSEDDDLMREKALEYCRKTLDSCDIFDEKLLGIAKQYCEEGDCEEDIEQGINMLKMLNDKGVDGTQDYVKSYADRLMRARHYHLAEQCYKICCDFDKSYCEKYIIARMFREISEKNEN